MTKKLTDMSVTDIINDVTKKNPKHLDKIIMSLVLKKEEFNFIVENQNLIRKYELEFKKKIILIIKQKTINYFLQHSAIQLSKQISNIQ